VTTFANAQKREALKDAPAAPDRNVGYLYQSNFIDMDLPTNFNLSPEALKNIINGDKTAILVWGTVKYADAFQCRRWVRFLMATSTQAKGATMPKFQRRHYCVVADWLRTAPMAIRELDRRLVAHSLADRLERDNPRFRRQRFLDAAGVFYSGASEDTAVAARLSLSAAE
jgi:hypothetical protein